MICTTTVGGGIHWCKRRRRRNAFTLIELVAVAVIIGLLAAMAAPRMTPDVLGNFGARVDARVLATDLAQARRRAILTGDDHLLKLQMAGSNVTGYTIHRDTGGSTTAVDSPREFPTQVSVTISPSADPQFNFQGEALSAYTLTLAGPDRTWQVTVAAATGAVRVTEL